MKHRIKEQNVPFPITVNSATSVKTGRSQGVDFTANTFYKLDSRPLPASHVTVEGPPTILPPIRAWRREQRDNSPGDTTGREAFPETFRAQETHCVVRLQCSIKQIFLGLLAPRTSRHHYAKIVHLSASNKEYNFFFSWPFYRLEIKVLLRLTM